MPFFNLGTHAYAVFAATLLLTANHSCFAQKSGEVGKSGNNVIATSSRPQHRDNVTGGKYSPTGAFGISFRKAQEKVIAANVLPGGAAYLAGMRSGDEIKAIDGHDIGSTAEAADALHQHPPTEELRVIVVPSGGARELDLLPPTRDTSRPKAMLGVILEDHSGAVLISELYVGGPAEIAGLRTGDRIVAIAGHRVNVRAQVVDILKQYRPADQVDLLVSRREWDRRVLVTLVSSQQIASLPRGSIQAATDSSPLRYHVPNGYGNLHWAEGGSVLNVYDVNRRALYTAFD